MINNEQFLVQLALMNGIISSASPPAINSHPLTLIPNCTQNYAFELILSRWLYWGNPIVVLPYTNTLKLQYTTRYTYSNKQKQTDKQG